MDSVYHTWTPADLPPGLKAKYEVTGTNLYGYDTSRRRFRVVCLDCNLELHPATTGPNSYIRDHEDVKHAVKTIKESMKALGFVDSYLDDSPLNLDVFKDWALDTHCGQECREILDRAAPLLQAVDQSALPDLWRGITRQLSIICMG